MLLSDFHSFKSWQRVSVSLSRKDCSAGERGARFKELIPPG